MKLLEQEIFGQLSTVHHFSMFMPLIRDLIIEASRCSYLSNTLVIQFSTTCQQIIGPAGFNDRRRYYYKLFGLDFHSRNTFCNSIWHHCTVLRRCFREAVFAQIEGLGIST